MGIDAQMFARTAAKVSEADVIRWSYEIGDAFGPDKFFIMDTDDGKHSRMQRAIEIIDEYIQDGPTITPDPGETFIEVHLWTRYYGRGYERGNFPLIVSVASWLESRIPQASVWYGGDSSGVCAQPFEREERDEMWKHFVAHGHRPYITGWNNSSLGGHEYGRPHCSLCNEAMDRNGWGGHYANYSCVGCGKQTATRDGGKTWFDPRQQKSAAV